MSPLPNPFAFRRRVPGRGFVRTTWWDFCAFLCWAWLRIAFGLRRLHRERVPRTGALLVISNHQSFIDPMACGVTVWDRQFTALARDSLFKGPLGWILRSVSSRPIRREGGDLEAMKTALSELEAGRTVIMFPEGTRSETGEMMPFKRGVLLLVRKARPTILPMGIAGSFEAWPKGRSLPRLSGQVVCTCGEPIDGGAIADLGPEEGLRVLEAAVAKSFAEARAALRSPRAAAEGAR